MGVVVVRYAHVCICTCYIEHVCMTFQAKYKRYKERTVLCTVEPECWVKLLLRIRD